MAQSIYRPSKNLDKDMYGDDLEARIKTNRYRVDRQTVGVPSRLQQPRKSAHDLCSFPLDLFLIRSFLDQTANREAEKDQCSLRRILLVWTSFWKKPNSTVVLKDPLIAVAPRNMSMKARSGGKSRGTS